MYAFRMRYPGVHNIADAAGLVGGPIARELASALFLLTWMYVPPRPDFRNRNRVLIRQQSGVWFWFHWTLPGLSSTIHPSCLHRCLDPSCCHLYYLGC